MTIQVALLTLATCLAFPSALIVADTAASSSIGMQRISRATEHFKATPKLSFTGSAARSKLFPVRDEKGLLLTCIAPEIDKNANTDIFSDCILAPDRSLDDVMHAFVSAIHYEHDRQSKEETKREDRSEPEPDQNATYR